MDKFADSRNNIVVQQNRLDKLGAVLNHQRLDSAINSKFELGCAVIEG